MCEHWRLLAEMAPLDARCHDAVVLRAHRIATHDWLEQPQHVVPVCACVLPSLMLLVLPEDLRGGRATAVCRAAMGAVLRRYAAGQSAHAYNKWRHSCARVITQPCTAYLGLLACPDCGAADGVCVPARARERRG